MRLGEPDDARDGEAWPRLRVGPGVWAQVRPDQAHVLRRGAVWALVLGLAGGAVASQALGGSWIGFMVGAGVFGVVGQLLGLVVASVGRRQD